MVKNPPANAGSIRNSVQSLDWEDPLEEEWQPSPLFLPGEPHEQRSLAAYSPWGHKELDMTEWLNMHAAQMTLERGVSLGALPSLPVPSSPNLTLEKPEDSGGNLRG